MVVKKFVNWSAAGSSVLLAAFSSASLGSALSIVRLLATIPLRGGGVFCFHVFRADNSQQKLGSKMKKTSRDCHACHG